MKTGVLAIVKKGDKYLVGVESKDSPIKGQWRFLGGHINNSESHVDGLERELQEEAGITVDVIRKIDEVQGDYADISISVYLAEWKSGELSAQEKEIRNLGWVSLPEMHGLNLSSLCRQVLDRYECVLTKAR